MAASEKEMICRPSSSTSLSYTEYLKMKRNKTATRRTADIRHTMRYINKED